MLPSYLILEYESSSTRGFISAIWLSLTENGDPQPLICFEGGFSEKIFTNSSKNGCVAINSMQIFNNVFFQFLRVYAS